MKVELHLIQSFAPSCLNRDDTNTPKSCMFGGFRRARISSQCLKRSMRRHMRDAQGLPTGTRTRRLAQEIVERLAQDGRDAEPAQQAVRTALTAANFKLENEADGRTSVGLYLCDDEIDRLAAAVEADWESLVAATPAEDPLGTGGGRRAARQAAKAGVTPAVDAAVKAIQDRVTAVDIALFGRMLAEAPTMNVDAACQVAHALSTHAVEAEMDFFTAVDDLQERSDDPGAGMMGIQEFNSACFYRYALIDREQLTQNLNGDRALAHRGILGFVRAALEAIPTGKQNSSAAQNPPDYLHVRVMDGMPLSLANAFEKPVQPNGKGLSLTELSVAELRQYRGRLQRMYGSVNGDEERWSSTLPCLDDAVPVPELLRWLEGRLAEER